MVASPLEVTNVRSPTTACTTQSRNGLVLENLLSKQNFRATGLDGVQALRIRSGVPQASRSSLPIEVLDNVFRFLSRPELLPALCVSSVFNNVAKRVLYHTIEDLSPVKSITVLLRLDREPALQLLVRKLDINWCASSLEPTRNLYNLLHRVLVKLKGLTALSIELPRTGSQMWILNGCTFSLRYFSTSMPCDAHLARYLDSQSSLTELTLRGYQQGVNVIPSFLGFSPSTDPADNPFKVLPTSLPKLSSLRTVHGGPNIIASVVEGRPVQAASIALFPSTSSESLKALSLSTAPMRRLSIMSFDPTVQDYLLLELAKRFPHLEALHVVILLSEFTDELLRALGPLLAPFKALQYITFMAATDRTAQPQEEQAIAKIWHQSCPTLKTIILPRGKVWFSEGQSEWNSLDAED
ncbi:hypothetical protein H0H87_011628 [Tephrocybe sp. NHM501043]|nr:hypothetical protein H0H87_011628 [Tephrocybe sp. NHM501043]